MTFNAGFIGSMVLAPMLLILFIGQAGAQMSLPSEKYPDGSNPYLGFRVLPSPEKLPSQEKSTWDYRRTAEYLFPAAKEIAEGRLAQDRQLVILGEISALLDSLLNELDTQGTWWSPNLKKDGDPNVNRFVLLPILDTLLVLRGFPEIRDRFEFVWREKLKRAVDFQFSAYSSEVAWDWAALAKGQYPNQDVYTALIMKISARLFGEDRYNALADELIKDLEKNILPAGGFHYIGEENESPLYHAVTQMVLARYYELTKAPTALKILRLSSEYWPLVLSAEGVAEYWSDAWWKQQWTPIPDTALTISAAVTDDPHLGWFKEKLLERPRARGSFADAYGAYWWRRSKAKGLPDRFHLEDKNIRGSRGRKGNWYYGVTQGRGLRNTFVGGLISSEKSSSPLEAAFRGSQIEVMGNGDVKKRYWLSEVSDQTAHCILQEGISVLGARYTLQPSIINGVPQPVTRPSSWQATQLWVAAPDGILGAVTITALEKNEATAVIGRVLAGPEPLVRDGKNEWHSGPLRVLLYRSFGVPTEKEMPAEAPSLVDKWSGLEFGKRLKGMKAGDQFQYVVWVGPETETPPHSVESSADGTVLKIVYGNRTFETKFDPAHRRLLTRWGMDKARETCSEHHLPVK